MFARIAGRYDLANRLLSGGTDVWWRWRLCRTVARTRPHAVLDLATGSGDVAFALARALPEAVRITGMDFCQPMLDEAVQKKARSPRYAKIEFLQGDAMALPLPDAAFDALTSPSACATSPTATRPSPKCTACSRPGGTLFVLDSRNRTAGSRRSTISTCAHLPWFAALVTGDKGAYDYLGGSIAQFPPAPRCRRRSSAPALPRSAPAR
jgi:demethylmenaquinone methyltransferase/2-methoxy-6-polyprenyl-1,4-benzoquinol methylase